MARKIDLEALCNEKGLRITEQRRVIARVLSDAEDHPDVETGKVLEFVDPELEQLQKQIAERLGFRLVDHRMELYGVALDRKS